MADWKLIDEQVAYQGKFRSVIGKKYELPNGFVGVYDVVRTEGNGACAILAITEDNRVVTFHQFRPGPSKVLAELPGGGVEVGEEPINAVCRELLEETGYEAEVEYIGSYYADAYTESIRHMFIGRNAKKVTESEHGEGEHGEVALLSLEDFKKEVFAGNMTDSTLGYAGLYRLGLL